MKYRVHMNNQLEMVEVEADGATERNGLLLMVRKNGTNNHHGEAMTDTIFMVPVSNLEYLEMIDDMNAPVVPVDSGSGVPS